MRELSATPRKFELVFLQLNPVLATFICHQLRMRYIVVPHLHAQSRNNPVQLIYVDIPMRIQKIYKKKKNF